MTMIDKAEAHDNDLIRRGVGVQDARDALEELANMPLGVPLEDWARLSARILASLEPAPTAADAREAALRQAADAWQAFKDATTTADHFAAVERLDAIFGETRA